MKILFLHPSALLYSNIYLRLEPLGLELVAEAARKAMHEVQLIDLQVEPQKTYFKILKSWQPDVVAMSCSYLANVPEIIALAKATKKEFPHIYVIVGGHSASFIPEEMLNHSEGAIDCILKGEGEAGIEMLLNAVGNDRKDFSQIPVTVTQDGIGPDPSCVNNIDDLFPARDLLRKPNKYFSAVLDPCASIEFSRGCPWNCTFCSAWTFYGRHYRMMDPEKVVDDLVRIEAPGVFVVDDVAFIDRSHGLAIGETILQRGIKKQFYLETRGDIILRNLDVFKFWKKVGLKFIFVGLEAIDESRLKRFNKHMTLSKNFEALEAARSLGIQIAVNIIADPGWDEKRFEVVRKWSMESPEIVNVSVYTTYPGTKSWYTETRKSISKDYRLFDLLHTVLPTHLPLKNFYEELVKTQQLLNSKFLGLKLIRDVGKTVFDNLMRGQTNFLKMMFDFKTTFKVEQQLAHHHQPVKYELSLPPDPVEKVNCEDFYILKK
jgi:hopanoid C-3 methylase HpnR